MTQKTRQFLFVLLALLTLAGVLGAVVTFNQRQMRLRGALDGLPDPALPYRVPVTGANVALEQYSPQDLNRQLDLLADSGIVWLRQTFAWDAIEPERGAYEWQSWDAVVEAVADHPGDLRLVAVLSGSPGWAADPPGTRPADVDAFHAFTLAFAQRYGESIDAYEIWDEPNLSASWGHPVDVIGYAELLQGAYHAIHQTDPNTAIVMVGGLAATPENSLDAVNDVLYLRDLNAAGARFYYDAVGVKAVDLGGGLNDRRVHAELLNFQRVILLREEMEAQGDTRKGLWVSSFAFENASPENQAAWTAGAFEQAAFEWPWAGGLMLAEWPPSDEVLAALRETTPSLLADATPGLYPASSALVGYEGEWVVSPIGANIRGPERIGYISLPFRGSEVALIARRPFHSTYMYAELNGQPAPGLPRNERGAYLVVTSPDLEPFFDTLPITSGLDPQVYNVIRLEHERTWVPWRVVGFAVGNSVRTLAYDLSIGALLALAGAAAWAARRLARGIDFGAWGQRVTNLYEKLGEAGQTALTLAAGLALWAGLALTFGGTLPQLTRRLDDGPLFGVMLLAAGVFYVSPSALLALAALVVLLGLIYLRLELGLMLVVLAAPFFLLPRALYGRFFTLVEVTVLLCLAAWTLRQVASWKEQAPPSPARLWVAMNSMDKAAVLFVSISVFSLTVAHLKGVAVTELRMVVLEPAAFYLMLRTTPLTRRDIWRLVDTLVVAGVIVALVGVYEFTTGIDIVEAEQGVDRLRSVYGSPNNVGLFLGRIMPLTLAITLTPAAGRRRILYALGGAAMLSAIVLSLSRGALLLGLPAGLVVVTLLLGGKRGRVAVGVGLASGAAALVPLAQHPRFKDLLNFSEGTTGFRLMLWQATLKMLRERPLFGVGLDNFLYEYRGRYILPQAWFEPNLSHPHNVLLDYWVRLGIIGLAAGVWLQVAFWKLAWGLQRRLTDTDPMLRALVVGLMGSMADFLAHGMVDNAYFVIDLAYVFFLTLGLIAVANQLPRMAFRSTTFPPSRGDSNDSSAA